ncbi:hypothetical protein GGI04_001618 [Coemansia thaxteri]|nr:hypothetical protein GGI04_001618 [Coemansia thaxteri]KAJ2484771.1 hypothetical protein EV174_002174 [Coemansia sp. RSA 2320]
MAKFVPFNGKGLCHYNHVDKGSFDLYETHWPKCTGVCAERAFKPFGQPEYPKFPSSFAASKPAGTPKAAKPGDGVDTSNEGADKAKGDKKNKKP